MASRRRCPPPARSRCRSGAARVLLLRRVERQEPCRNRSRVRQTMPHPRRHHCVVAGGDPMDPFAEAEQQVTLEDVEGLLVSCGRAGRASHRDAGRSPRDPCGPRLGQPMNRCRTRPLDVALGGGGVFANDQSRCPTTALAGRPVASASPGTSSERRPSTNQMPCRPGRSPGCRGGAGRSSRWRSNRPAGSCPRSRSSRRAGR